MSRKQKTQNFSKIEHFLPPDTHTYVCVSGGKKCSFFQKFNVLRLLETPILRFALLPYLRRTVIVYQRFGEENIAGKEKIQSTINFKSKLLRNIFFKHLNVYSCRNKYDTLSEMISFTFDTFDLLQQRVKRIQISMIINTP